MNKKLLLVSMLVMAFFTTSCDKFETVSEDFIRFTCRNSSPEQTKVSYSGVNSDNVERLDWSEGDMIRICCDSVSKPSSHQADYIVSNISADGKYSKAKLSVFSKISENGMSWGKGTHVFNAVYPSPAASGVTKSITVSDGQVSGEIPAVQGYTLTGTGDVVANPVLEKTMMMVAKTQTAKKTFGDNEVFLDFVPVTTAINLVLTNKTGSSLKVKSVGLSSKTHPLSGSFSLTIGSNGTGIYADYPLCSFSGTLSDADKAVACNFPESGEGSLLWANEKTLTLTLMINPCDELDDLVFHIVDYTDGERMAKLQKSDGTKVTFKKHYKTYVSGLFVPKGALWYVSMEPSLVNWEDAKLDDSGALNLTQPLSEAGAFVSYWSSGVDEDVPLVQKTVATSGTVVLWGDSITQPYYFSSKLKSLLGADWTVVNAGVPSDPASVVAGRQGGYPCYTDDTDFVLPKSASDKVEVGGIWAKYTRNDVEKYDNILTFRTTSSYEKNQAISPLVINGIECIPSFVEDSPGSQTGKCYLQRKTDGTEDTVIPARSEVSTYASREYRDAELIVVYFGTNGIEKTTEYYNYLINTMDAMFGFMTNKDKDMIVCGFQQNPDVLSSYWTQNYVNLMSARYGDHFIDQRTEGSINAVRYMKELGMISDESEISDEDKAYIAAGNWPSAWGPVNNVHPNEYGYYVRALLVYDKMKELGYVKATI